MLSFMLTQLCDRSARSQLRGRGASPLPHGTAALAEELPVALVTDQSEEALRARRVESKALICGGRPPDAGVIQQIVTDETLNVVAL